MNKLKSLVLDKEISIEIRGGHKLKGILKNVNRERGFIQLLDVFVERSGKTTKGLQYFYVSEMTAIHQDVPQEEFAFGNDQKIDEAETLTPLEIKTKLSTLEVKQIEERIESAVYIYHCDSTFYDAIDDLQREEIFALNIEGAEFGRLKQASIISCSTEKKIYLFDLLLLGEILKPLKNLLEENVPRKIVHNSSLIVDWLKHGTSTECNLNGIVDTVILHTSITKEKKIIAIDKCFSIYFEMPQTFFKVPKKIDWHKRPLSQGRLTYAAANVAYLKKIYFFMVHDILLQPLKQMTLKFSQQFAKIDDIVNVYHLLNKDQNPDFQSIDLSALKINVEFDGNVALDSDDSNSGDDDNKE